MALSGRQKVVFFLVVVGALAVVQVFMFKLCSFKSRALILRADFIGILEFLMLLFSWAIWRTFIPLIYSLSSSSSSHQVLNSSSSNEDDLSGRPMRKHKNSDINLQTESNNEADAQQNTFSTIIFKSVLLLYLGLCHISYLTNLFILDTDTHWFGMLTYGCLGSFIQLLTGLGMLKLLSFIISQFKRVRYSVRQPSGLSQKYITALSLAYMIVASTIGLYTASQPPHVRHVDIPIKTLPFNLEGLTIVQLSDIHLGPTVGFSKLKRIVDIVQKEEPDVLVITGDLVDGSVKHLKGAAEPLSAIDSKYGKFFVSGNHEYYTADVDNWFKYLEYLGFTILHNSNVKVPGQVKEGEGQICFAGTDDVQADKIGYENHSFDLDKAVASCAEDMTVILLAHQPVAAKTALDSSHKIDLVLSGHTHGGQMFPLVIGAYLLNPFYVGLYQYGKKGSHVYVSQGTQYWGIPMRIGTSMEITKLRLKQA